MKATRLYRALWVLAFVFAACSSRRPTVPAEPAAAASPEWLGTAMVQDSHCGGARLTDEMMARLRRPAGGRTFVVLPGEKNSPATPVARFTTGPDGSFHLEPLPPSSYCVVEASRQLSKEQEARILAEPPVPRAPPLDAADTAAVDPECLRRLPLKCDAVWNTTQPRFRPDLWLPGHRCPWNRPCSTYRGPMPP